jgi:hypothetical protein
MRSAKGPLLTGATGLLVVHQGQQLRGGLRIAALNGGQDAGDFAQERRS